MKRPHILRKKNPTLFWNYFLMLKQIGRFFFQFLRASHDIWSLLLLWFFFQISYDSQQKQHAVYELRPLYQAQRDWIGFLQLCQLKVFIYRESKIQIWQRIDNSIIHIKIFYDSYKFWLIGILQEATGDFWFL